MAAQESQNNEKLIRELYRNFDDRNLDEAFSHFDDNVEFKVMATPDKTLRGLKEVRDGLTEWRKTFPDMKAEIRNVISAGDTVVVEALNHGTHEGVMESKYGPIQPTHRKIDVPSCDVFTISNGKVRNWICYWQGDVMMDQLGLMQQPKAAA